MGKPHVQLKFVHERSSHALDTSLSNFLQFSVVQRKRFSKRHSVCDLLDSKDDSMPS